MLGFDLRIIYQILYPSLGNSIIDNTIPYMDNGRVMSVFLKYPKCFGRLGRWANCGVFGVLSDVLSANFFCHCKSMIFLQKIKHFSYFMEYLFLDRDMTFGRKELGI